MSIDTNIIRDFTITDPESDPITATLAMDDGSEELPDGVKFGPHEGDVWRFEWPRWDDEGREDWFAGTFRFKITASDGKDTSSLDFIVRITEMGAFGQFLHFNVDVMVNESGSAVTDWFAAIARLSVQEAGEVLDETSFTVEEVSSVGQDVEGSISVSSQAQANETINLDTYENWSYFGENNNEQINKANVDPLVTNFTTPTTDRANLEAKFSWSDGDPLVSATDEERSFDTTTEGHKWTFRLPADTSERTVHIFVMLSGSNILGRFTAALSDESDMPKQHDIPGPGSTFQAYRITLTYRAEAADQHLDCEWIVQERTGGRTRFGVVALWATDGAGGGTSDKDNLIDSDANTVWRSSSGPAPHWAVINLQAVRLIQNVQYTPRQDSLSGRAKEGRIMLRDTATWNNDAVHVNSYNIETDSATKALATTAVLPSMTSVANQTISEGGTLSLAGSASHPQGTPSLSLLRIDEGDTPVAAAFVDDGDGGWSLDWTPEAGDAGDYRYAVVADTGGYVSTRQFAVAVTSATEPEFKTFPSDISVGSGTEIDVNVSAEHPNGIPEISVAMADETDLPDGVSFVAFAVSGNQRFYKFTWTPIPSQAGNYTFLFTAERDGASVSQDWSVTVTVHTIAPGTRTITFSGASTTIILR